MKEVELKELKEVWSKVLGDDCPDDTQFEIWCGLRPAEVVAWAICKTAARNRAKSEPMSQDHRIRYVSSVLIHYDNRPLKQDAKQDATPVNPPAGQSGGQNVCS